MTHKKTVTIELECELPIIFGDEALIDNINHRLLKPFGDFTKVRVTKQSKWKEVV